MTQNGKILESILSVILVLSCWQTCWSSVSTQVHLIHIKAVVFQWHSWQIIFYYRPYKNVWCPENATGNFRCKWCIAWVHAKSAIVCPESRTKCFKLTKVIESAIVMTLASSIVQTIILYRISMTCLMSVYLGSQIIDNSTVRLIIWPGQHER